MDLYNKWLEYPLLDAKLRDDLLNMSEEERQDAFYTQLQFGTAGMRGLLGPGTNRMNIYTIRKANLGFGKWIAAGGEEAKQRGVAIAHDNRHQSREFALESARVMAMLGIKSYLFDTLRPTPELSYAVRRLNCYGGIMITASHNPKEYNGYKVYDETGCQLVPQLIERVIELVNEVADPLSIEVDLSPEAEVLMQSIGKDIDEDYYQEVLAIQLRPEIDKSKLRIVFSPQHGTALKAVEAVYERAGYNYILVKEQATADPDFSQTPTPNPEEARAYELAIDYARRENADIAIATDPDADRIGVVVHHQGKFQLLTGNQTGAILIDYIFSAMKENQLLPEQPIMFDTVVTSDLGELIAKNYDVETEKTLTGFKFIGERIHHYENAGGKNFVFGYEESYGYLIRPFVRDKDAVQAALMIAECSAYYRNQGKTLIDALEKLYQKYGYYSESQKSFEFKGQEGAVQMQALMNRLHNEEIVTLAEVKVVAKEDYLQGKRYEGVIEKALNLPKSDVVKFFMEDGSWIAVRPSGTEPKCKFYYCVRGESMEDCRSREDKYQEAMNRFLE